MGMSNGKRHGDFWSGSYNTIGADSLVSQPFTRIMKNRQIPIAVQYAGLRNRPVRHTRRSTTTTAAAAAKAPAVYSAITAPALLPHRLHALVREQRADGDDHEEDQFLDRNVERHAATQSCSGARTSNGSRAMATASQSTNATNGRQRARSSRRGWRYTPRETPTPAAGCRGRRHPSAGGTGSGPRWVIRARR